MSDTILNALIELVKAGGPLALWGIGIWLSFTVFKVFLVGLVGYLVVRTVCNTVISVYQASLNHKREQVSLLSKEVIKDLTTYLDSFRDSLSALLKDLELQFQASRKE